MSKISEKYLEIVLLPLVFATVVIKNYIDLRIYYSSDEIQSYFVKGFTQNSFSEFSLVSGGIYVDFYYLLSKFFMPLEAIIFIRMFTSLFFSTCIYFSVRLLTNRAYGLLALIAVSLMPFTYSRPTHHLIAASFVILSIFLILKFSMMTALIFITPLMSIATGLRAEYIVATIIFFLLNFIVILDKLKITKLKKYYIFLPNIVLGVIFPLYIFLRYKYPYNLYSSRSYDAFADYFNTRSVSPGVNPYSNWDSITKTFDSSQSLMEALIYSPSSVLSHIAKNIIDIPKFLILNTFQIPNHSYIPSTQIFATASLAGLFLVALFYSFKFKNKIFDVIHYALISKAKVLLILVLLIPNLISMTVVYTVYMHAIFATAIILSFSWLNLIMPQPKKLFAIFLMLYAVFLVELSIKLVSHTPNNTIQTILYLDSKNIKWKTLKISYQNLLPAEQILLRVDFSDQGLNNFSSTQEYFEKNEINLIFYNSTVQDSSFLSLKDFAKFLENPKSLGFEPLLSDSKIWIKVADD